MNPKKECYITGLQDSLDSAFFKALAEPVRIELMLIMAGLGESDVSSIADCMSQDASVISRHLKLMDEAGVVVSRREGRHTFYRMNGDSMVAKLEDLTKSIKAAVKAGCC
jgi:DNA-binding transcriptional ArsR family regulator